MTKPTAKHTKNAKPYKIFAPFASFAVKKSNNPAQKYD